MFDPDLVTTLRICERDQAVDKLMNDAADEIERLRARVEELEEALVQCDLLKLNPPIKAQVKAALASSPKRGDSE